MSYGAFSRGNALIDFFNESIAAPAGVAPIEVPRWIYVDTTDETSYPITVWRQTPATIQDVHHKSNEDGFRWTKVHTGITQLPTYKPF